MNSIQEKIIAYFDRDPQLRVLFIFNDKWLADDLQHAEWPDGCRYVEFKEDWFTTKYKLDNDWQHERVIMMFEQPSPLKDKSLQEGFPLMDVLVANMEYHNQDYAAFMQQYNLPSAMTKFVEKNIQQLQSDKLLQLLTPYYLNGSITEDMAVRGMICNYLGAKNILDWDPIILKILFLGYENSASKRNDFYVRLRSSKDISDRLEQKLTEIFGVGFEANTTEKVALIIKVLKYNAIVQNLSVNEADNYSQYRVKDTYALQHINRILELALSNDKSAKTLMQLIDQLGGDIRDEDIIRWYGTEADYYFVPDALCIPIIKTLMTDKIDTEPTLVINRIEELMMKHGDNGEMCSIMDYTLLAARFYEKAKSLGSSTLNKPDEYIRRYEQEYYVIDQLYRQSLESYFAIDPNALLFDTVQTTKKALDIQYSKLANVINLEWMRCVKETGGMNEVHLLRQQDFYDEKVKTVKKKLVVIVSDALRYEVAQELTQELAKSKHIATLESALAMLPTETKFCKPALFPHHSMKLYGSDKEQNMSIDNKVLDSTAKRSEQLGLYNDKAICIDFKEVATYEQDKNREIFKHPLVYVMHNTIDEKSHGASAADVVKNCREAINELKTLVHKLLETYNVTEAYITSDHGFLFNDIEFAEKDKHKIDEENLERKTRYYLTHSTEELKGITKFRLSEVSGMDNVSDVLVGVPTGTNRLAAPSGGYMFTHGGASLQEILIPIVTIKQERGENTKQPVNVTLLDRNLSMQASRIRFKLLQTDAVSMDRRERIITCALYLNDVAVTPVKTIVLDKTDPSLDNRKIQVDLTLNSNVSAKVLQLKIYDTNDELNPLIKENVTNNTLIESDFD